MVADRLDLAWLLTCRTESFALFEDFSLKTETRGGIAFELLGAADLSWTPPSLEIISKNNSAWMKTLAEEKMISTDRHKNVFLSGSMDDGMIYRWIYVVLTN